MPRNNSKKLHSPDSDTDSSSSDSVKMYMIQEKHHHKHHKKTKEHHIKEHHNKEHHNKEHYNKEHHNKEKEYKHKKECESESLSENSECIELEKNECKHKREHKHKKESCSSEENHDSCDDSSSSDCDKDKCTFDDIYKYYKYQLLSDCSLQVAGSDAYINTYNNTVQNITTSYPVTFNMNDLNYNVDHPRFDAPYCVRKSGIYMLFFIILTQQAAQYTLFINGVPNLISSTGNNAGAGQTIFRQMYSLNKDDTLIIRNYESTAPSLISPLNIGGLQTGNNATFLLFKIAPLPCSENKKLCASWSSDCLSRRKHYLFKKLVEKMLCDNELMMKGFNIHGSFYSKNTQTVGVEGEFAYDAYTNVTNMSWSPSAPTKIVINEDGIYKIFFLTDTTTAAQLAFGVNDIPVESSIFGSNRGAGQITIRTIIQLKKGDLLSVINHTSAAGNIITSNSAGGSLTAISNILTIFKMAPICKPVLNECKINDYYKKYYNKFKSYLLANKCLQITGSDSYCNYVSTNSQVLQIGDAIDWEITTLKENVGHRQATSNTVIYKDGIYDIFIDCITSEPSQFTLFINGNPDVETTFGRDSGANKCVMRQFVKLCKGDVIDIRNYSSTSINVTTSLNSGGSLPGIPVFFMIFKLSNIDDDNKCCNKKYVKTIV